MVSGMKATIQSPIGIFGIPRAINKRILHCLLKKPTGASLEGCYFTLCEGYLSLSLLFLNSK